MASKRLRRDANQIPGPEIRLTVDNAVEPCELEQEMGSIVLGTAMHYEDTIVEGIATADYIKTAYVVGAGMIVYGFTKDLCEHAGRWGLKKIGEAQAEYTIRRLAEWAEAKACAQALQSAIKSWDVVVGETGTIRHRAVLGAEEAAMRVTRESHDEVLDLAQDEFRRQEAAAEAVHTRGLIDRLFIEGREVDDLTGRFRRDSSDDLFD